MKTSTLAVRGGITEKIAAGLRTLWGSKLIEQCMMVSISSKKNYIQALYNNIIIVN